MGEEEQAHVSTMMTVTANADMCSLDSATDCNVAVYIAGYLAKKCKSSQPTCGKCSLESSSSWLLELPLYAFIGKKQYASLISGGLCVPTLEFAKMIIKLEVFFRHNILKYVYNHGILDQLLKQATLIAIEAGCVNSCCVSSLNYVVKLFLRLRLHHFIKQQNQKLCQPKNRQNRKYLKLSNA